MSGFFDDPRVQDALVRLAQAENITIFVGAGASMEVGLPSWSGLIDRLLVQVAQDRHLRGERVEEFINRVRHEADGVIGAATVVRAHFNSPRFHGDGDAFIREALYRSSDGEYIVPRFGPTAKAVAELLPLWPLGQLEIITTNYDLLLEQAVDDLITWRGQANPLYNLVGATVVGDGSQVERNRFGVRHVHGALDPRADPARELKPVIIAEADYFQVQGEESWQRELILTRLSASTCLFVGASMTDVNVLRFLRLARERGAAGDHIVLLTRGSEQLSNDDTLNEELRDAISARWAEYGVEVLHPQFFLETSQFLDELGRCRRAHVAGECVDAPEKRYRGRLATWECTAAQTILVTRQDGLTAAQDRANKYLREYLSAVLGAMPMAVHAECSRATFGLEVWAVQDAGRSLLKWASSTSSWREAAALRRVPIERPTQYVAVESFCVGSPIYRVFPDTLGSRWQTALSVPVFLDKEPLGRLPVGVIVLKEMDRHGGQVLNRVGGEARDSIINILAMVGKEFLTPTAST